MRAEALVVAHSIGDHSIRPGVGIDEQLDVLTLTRVREVGKALDDARGIARQNLPATRARQAVLFDDG